MDDFDKYQKEFFEKFIKQELSEGKIYFYAVKDNGLIFYARSDMIGKCSKFDNYSDAYTHSCYIRNGWVSK